MLKADILNWSKHGTEGRSGPRRNFQPEDRQDIHGEALNAEQWLLHSEEWKSGGWSRLLRRRFRRPVDRSCWKFQQLARSRKRHEFERITKWKWSWWLQVSSQQHWLSDVFIKVIWAKRKGYCLPVTLHAPMSEKWHQANIWWHRRKRGSFQLQVKKAIIKLC